MIVHGRAIPSLTGIRGAAAIWVVAYHVQHLCAELTPRLLGSELFFLRDGWEGVDLFFILSGFVLMHVHSDQFEKLSRAAIADFARLRIWRIYPVSSVALLAVAALAFVDRSFHDWFMARAPGNFSLAAFLKTAVLATNWHIPIRGDWNTPVWSLSVEIVGYICFPLLAFACLRLRSFMLLIMAAVVAVMAVIAVQLLQHQLGSNLLTGPGSIIRVLGFFSAGVILRRAADFSPPWIGRWLVPVSVLAVLMIPVLSSAHQTVGLMPIVFAILVYSLAFQVGPIDRLLRSRFALFFGKISFPLYVLHAMPLMALFFHLSRSTLSLEICWLYVGAVVAALIVLAFIVHRYFEKPLQMWVHGRPS